MGFFSMEVVLTGRGCTAAYLRPSSPSASINMMYRRRSQAKQEGIVTPAPSPLAPLALDRGYDSWLQLSHHSATSPSPTVLSHVLSTQNQKSLDRHSRPCSLTAGGVLTAVGGQGTPIKHRGRDRWLSLQLHFRVRSQSPSLHYHEGSWRLI